MSGSSGLAVHVSEVLRKAGLPVPYSSERAAMRGRSGIRVGNETTRYCTVFFYAYEDDLLPDSAQDEELKREWCDEARAVLVTAGFDVDWSPGVTLLTVRRGRGAALAEDVDAVVQASGLNIDKITHNEWHVEVNGKRGEYDIRRTGKEDRTQYAVHSRKHFGGPLEKNLRTMAAAIEFVKQHIEKST